MRKDRIGSPPTAERLRQVISYDPESGHIAWLSPHPFSGNKPGDPTGSAGRVMVDGFSFTSPQLAWMYVTGEFPEHKITFINGNKGDVRFVNLRCMRPRDPSAFGIDRKLVSPAHIRQQFTYDEATGEFRHRHDKKAGPKHSNIRAVAGTIATSNAGKGYLKVVVFNRSFLAHRAAWAYVHGEWPEGQIDHINGVRHDNRLSNLRDVSQSENQHNQCVTKRRKADSPLAGAHFNKPWGKWQAMIGVNGKSHSLGGFATAEEAHAAYLAAKAVMHPTWPNARHEDQRS